MDKKKDDKRTHISSINSSRREFLKKGLAGLAGISVFSLPDMKAGNPGKPQEPLQEKKVIYRTLGKTGIKLPIVSMGALNANNPELVRAALDAGIVLLDTAHSYQQGRNEEMIGQVLKSRPRDSYVILTKAQGDHLDWKTGFFTKGTRAESFVKKFEISLKRLGLDYVDIFCLHSVGTREALLFEPLLSAMIKFKKEGKTRFIGVSTHRSEPEVLNAAVDNRVHDVVITAYNFLQPHREEMSTALTRAARAGLGIVAMKTQAGVYWDKERKHQINMKAALKWVLKNENIHTAVPGFSTFEQMNLDLSVMEDLTLTPTEKADLKLGQESRFTGLYCRQCGKCLSQCRKNLDIPLLMRSYMYAYGYRNLALAAQTLEGLRLPGFPCQDCGTCHVQCTMEFNVRNKIFDIARIKDIPGIKLKDIKS